MSLDVKCEKCGTEDRRVHNHPSPENWYWMEVRDDSTGDIIVAYACSIACRDGLWQKGPGPRWKPGQCQHGNVKAECQEKICVVKHVLRE